MQLLLLHIYIYHYHLRLFTPVNFPSQMLIMFPESFHSKTHFSISTIFLLSIIASSSSSDLSYSFYGFSCPNAEQLVKDTVQAASGIDPTIPGKLLRLFFHDCMVEGCDASLLIKGNGTERTDPANSSVAGFEVIDSAKKLLEVVCPGTVSCADIVVLAARDAVEYTEGPSILVPTGRRDGRISLASNVMSNIIDTDFTVDEMMKVFSSKNLSMDDLVTLSGAHTIGSSHCNFFSDRFQEEANGTVTATDDSLEKNYAVELAKKCKANDSASVSNDPYSSSQFDNLYFQSLLDGKGLFQSDAALAQDKRTRPKVELFTGDQESFFLSWEESFLKLAAVGVKTGEEGEIRSSCMEVNR